MIRNRVKGMTALFSISHKHFASWQLVTVNVNQETASTIKEIPAELLDHEITSNIFLHVLALLETTSWVLSGMAFSRLHLFLDRTQDGQLCFCPGP